MEATTAHQPKIRHRKGGGYFVACPCGMRDFAEHKSTASIIKIEHTRETAAPPADPYNLRAAIADPFVGLQ